MMSPEREKAIRELTQQVGYWVKIFSDDEAVLYDKYHNEIVSIGPADQIPTVEQVRDAME